MADYNFLRMFIAYVCFAIKAMLFLFPVKAVEAHMISFSGSTACTGGTWNIRWMK